MKKQTRVLLVAAVVVAVILSVRHWTAPAFQRGVEPVAPVVPEAPGELDPPAPSGENDGSAAAVATTDGERRQVEEAAVPVEVEEAAPTHSQVVARITDDRGEPLASARLQVVKRDGTTSDISPSEPSGPDGVVTLMLEDEELRTWAGEVRRMRFAVSAPERATRFIVGTPKRRDTLDLGVIELDPGATVRGRVIDGAGAGVAAADVVAGEVALESAIELMQITGPDPDVTRLRAVAGVDGRFELLGLPAGELRLAAHAEAMLWSFTEPFPIQAGAVVDAPPIVLEPVPASSLAAGVVVDPTGVPVAGVDVYYSGGMLSHSSGDVKSDVAGRFAIATPHEALQLRAVDATGEYDLEAVPAGDCSFQHEVEGDYGLGWYSRGQVKIEPRAR